MPLRLFNTLTKSKDVFAPIDAKNVRMYVCGPTVYDFAHIGNARPAIVFDLLFRLLRHTYGDAHVTYVRNITDVDDKINDRALRDFPDLPLNQAIRNVTEKTEAQYHADVDALGCLRPTFEPRATENIPGMIAIIEQLIARGHAYEANGEVLFDVQSMPDYGQLSRRNLDEQQAGARVAVDAHKKHAHDFVLWKLSADNEPGWESPWGRGRPGWHIECSAMSAAHLGTVFDIHGGGLDLIFPHHENEIAQSRCAHGTHTMANVWMHNGFLQVEGEKMSKSAGNFFTIRDLLDKEHPEVLRLQMLLTHYRQPIDWTDSARKQARAILNHWYQFAGDSYPLELSSNELKPVFDALSDDLNTPVAIGLFTQTLSPMALKAAANFLGLLKSNLATWQRWTPPGQTVDETEIARAIEARKAARAAKNFADSDRIRDEMLAKGIVLKDGPQGTTWEVKR
jgi:cysteinyl-tRNA synthetase